MPDFGRIFPQRLKQSASYTSAHAGDSNPSFDGSRNTRSKSRLMLLDTGSLFVIFCSSQSLVAHNGTSHFLKALKENKDLKLIMSRLVNSGLGKILNFKFCEVGSIK